MPTHRPARVGVAILGILALIGPAWGQAAPSPVQGAYAGFVPLLERDEPRPSFWGEADPSPGGDEPAQAAAEEAPAPGSRQAAAEEEGADHAHH